MESNTDNPGAGINVEQGLAETLLMQGPDALLLLSTEGTISFLNPAAERLFGYARDQLIGVGHRRLLVEDDRGGFLRVLSRLGRTGIYGTKPFNAVGLHRDGREIPLEMTCSLVTVQGETSMAVAVRDVSHRADADAGRRQAVSLLDATLETTADGIVVVSNTGQITGVNEQYLRLWGMPREILAEDDASALVRFIAKQLLDPDSFKAKVAELYANHELHSQDLLEFQDGRTVELYSRPQKVAEEVVGRIWNFRDVTSRTVAQDQARRALEELAQQADQLKALAFRDPLTGLANRMLFNERATEALESPGSVAVLLLDLDDFKEVNDILGHHAGDQMLVEISRRLQNCVGPHGTVARLGGDEFVVLLVDCNDSDAVAQRIVSTLNAPVTIEGTLMRPGLSLGVATRSEEGMSSSELLRQADVAMYAAKEAGKNCYVHFQPEMLATLLERTQLAAGLRRAVELGQITVFYQPVVSTNRREVVQYEALARWERDGVLMPPDTFIQTAERSGLIRDIGAEVLPAELHRTAVLAGRGSRADPGRERLRRAVAAQGLRRAGAGHRGVEQGGSAPAGPRGHRERVLRRRHPRDPAADHAARGGHPGGAGRFRHRLLLARPAAGASGGRGEDRQIVRVHAAHRRGAAPHPDLDDPHGPQPGPAGDRGGHRDAQAGPVPDGA